MKQRYKKWKAKIQFNEQIDLMSFRTAQRVLFQKVDRIVLGKFCCVQHPVNVPKMKYVKTLQSNFQVNPLYKKSLDIFGQEIGKNGVDNLTSRPCSLLSQYSPMNCDNLLRESGQIS